MYASWPQSTHFSGPLWSISTLAPLGPRAVQDDGHGWLFVTCSWTTFDRLTEHKWPRIVRTSVLWRPGQRNGNGERRGWAALQLEIARWRRRSRAAKAVSAPPW